MSGIASIIRHPALAAVAALVLGAPVLAGCELDTVPVDDGAETDPAVDERGEPRMLDQSFSGDGKSLTVSSNGESRVGQALGIDPRGRAIVGGRQVSGGQGHFVLTRWNLHGLDKTFGDDGYVVTDFASSTDEGIYDLVVDSGGDIVAAGYATIDGKKVMALARYHANGSLDTSFDGDGKVLTDFASSTAEVATSLSLGSFNRIVVAGYATVDGKRQFAVAKYDADGKLDASFDGDGKVLTNFASSTEETINDVIADPYYITAVGHATVDGKKQVAVARYSASSGALENTFDDDGKVLFTYAGGAVATTVENSPKSTAIVGKEPLIGGYTYLNGKPHFLVLELKSNGSLDQEFGLGGFIVPDFASSTDERITDLAVVGGAVLAGGWAIVDGKKQFAIMKVSGLGLADTAFDGDGKILTDFLSSENEGMEALGVTATGRVIGAGHAQIDGHSQIAVASYDLEPLAKAQGDLECAYGDPQCNRCVPNVEAEFAHLGGAHRIAYDSHEDQRLPPHDANLTHFGKHRFGVDWDFDGLGDNWALNHVQGFARVALDFAGNDAYFVGTRNQYGGNGRGGFFVTRIDRGTGAKGGPLKTGVSPNTNDRDVRLFFPVDGTNHPGGLSLAGGVMVYGAECSRADEESCDGVAFVDTWRLDGIEDEDKNADQAGSGAWRVHRFQIDGSRGEQNQKDDAALASIVRLESGRYMLLVLGGRSKEGWIYLSKGTPGFGGFDWEYRQHLTQDSLPARWKDAMYQNMSFVTECGTGKLYAVGVGSDSEEDLNSVNGEDDTNYLDLYRVAPNGAGVKFNLVDQHDMAANGYCVNRAAGSVYVTPEGGMVYYCHSKVTNGDGELKLEERIFQ